MTDYARLVGALVIAGCDGFILPQAFESRLRADSLGGVILFARNYHSRRQLRQLTESIRRAAPRALIAVDQEGGRVVRFSGDFPSFPSPLHYALSRDLEGFLQATTITARELRADGVNLNLIPVCDLAPPNSDHVVHARAYSADPLEVAAVVTAQVNCLHRCGVAACAKHFPGLASATGDPHFVVSASAQARGRFHAHDYEPFRAAACAGVDLIMTTHLRATELDPTDITTFSRRIVSGELRGEVAFHGLVISDDLQMLGALERIDQIAAGARALGAGHDLILFANLHDDLDHVVDGIAQAAEKDEALAQRIEESYNRVGMFKEEHPGYFRI